MSDLEDVRFLIRNADWTFINQLIWFPSLSVGWYPVKDEERYDDDYFEKFEQYRLTIRGEDINQFRVDFVNSVIGDDQVVDIGVGCGHFLDSRPNNRGYDVSEYGKRLIKERNVWFDINRFSPESITCWDSLEHMKDCWSLVERVKRFVFVSIPIYSGPDSVVQSKHFKPHEHWWYPTEAGLIKCFEQLGFVCVKTSYGESVRGRSSIGTYAFQRKNARHTPIPSC